MILTLCTPTETIFEGKIQSANLPTVGGAMTILPLHISISSQLNTGIVEIIDENNQKINIVVNGGVINFDKEKLSIATLEAQILVGEKTSKLFDQNLAKITAQINKEIQEALDETQIYKADPVAINMLNAEKQARLEFLNELLK